MANINVDEFEVVKQIGKGSFSTVYLCTREYRDMLEVQHGIPEEFIIKEININVLVKKYIRDNCGTYNKPHAHTVEVNITPYSRETHTVALAKVEEGTYYTRKLQQLIKSEVDALSLTSHENIVEYYGCSKRDSIYYLCMEYCDGGDVYQLLKNQPNSRCGMFVYNFTKQTVDGLAYMHEQGLIHRDIKLQNILVSGTNCFKISDFGFACYDMSIKEDENDVLCKKYFKLCGTPYYMAPELIACMNTNEITQPFYNQKVDIWSLGMSLTELLTGVVPLPTIRNIKELEAFYLGDTAEKHIHDTIGTNQMIPNVYKTLLYNMLKTDPACRSSSKDIADYINKHHQDFQVDLVLENVRCDPSTRTFRTHGDNTERSNIQDESWEKIDTSSSLIMKLSVGKGFLDWLLGKN